MSRRQRPTTIEVAIHRVRRANADLAGACHRFIVGSPDSKKSISTLRLDRWSPALRFNVGPLVVVNEAGTPLRQPGDVLHMWVPRSPNVGRPAHE